MKSIVEFTQTFMSGPTPLGELVTVVRSDGSAFVARVMSVIDTKGLEKVTLGRGGMADDLSTDYLTGKPAHSALAGCCYCGPGHAGSVHGRRGVREPGGRAARALRPFG